MKRKLHPERTTVGYTRVSTDKQADNGISMEAQRDRIEMMAKMHGWELAEVLEDAGFSAGKLDRPAMKRLLEMVEAGEIGRVVIAKLDRLTRNVRDLATLVDLFGKHGVAIVSVAETLDTGTAVGRMVMNLITVVAQWEREAVGERTRDAFRALKARGIKAGTPPYGWRSQGGGLPLIEVPEEQGVLRQMLDMRDHGELSYREIADQLNEEGYTTRKGTPWRFQYVASILECVRRGR